MPWTTLTYVMEAYYTRVDACMYEYVHLTLVSFPCWPFSFIFPSAVQFTANTYTLEPLSIIHYMYIFLVMPPITMTVLCFDALYTYNFIDCIYSTHIYVSVNLSPLVIWATLVLYYLQLHVYHGLTESRSIAYGITLSLLSLCLVVKS